MFVRVGGHYYRFFDKTAIFFFLDLFWPPVVSKYEKMFVEWFLLYSIHIL